MHNWWLREAGKLRYQEVIHPSLGFSLFCWCSSSVSWWPHRNSNSEWSCAVVTHTTCYSTHFLQYFSLNFLRLRERFACKHNTFVFLAHCSMVLVSQRPLVWWECFSDECKPSSKPLTYVRVLGAGEVTWLWLTMGKIWVCRCLASVWSLYVVDNSSACYQ